MKPASSLAHVVEPIVRGQLRDFAKAHPGCLEERWISSITKRIVNDLASRDSRLRLAAVLGGSTTVQDRREMACEWR